ncbi:CsbD family protein [Leuconostoc sp. MS02]|uniref:CsbD family protein n=1 Tax=Leuconostoc aquikimchii TaxID=3236804 RepID=A0ABV3S2G9_9LACO
MTVEEKFDNAKDKVAGKAKEVEGKVTGDKSREVEGKAQGLFGKAKDKLVDATEVVKDKAEDAFEAVKDGVDNLKK